MKIFFFITLVGCLNSMGCYPAPEPGTPPTSIMAGVSEMIAGESVEITYIANEGVFIRAGDKQVLIDA